MLNKERFMLWKIDFRAAFLIFGFVLSLFSSFLLTLFFIFLILFSAYCLYRKDEKQLLRILVLVCIRGVLNDAFFPGITSINSILKWMIVFGESFLLVLFKSDLNTKHILKNVCPSLLVFELYLIFSSLLVSSFPITSVLKSISYVFPFIAIIKGVCDCKNKCNIAVEISIALGLIVFLSILSYPFAAAWNVNLNLFQGFVNHPNIYGVLVAVFLSFYFYSRKSFSFTSLVVFFVCLAFSILSKSRSGIFSCVIVFLLFICSSNNKNKAISFLSLFIITSIAFLIIISDRSMSEALSEVILKGYSGLFSTRDALIERNMLKFYTNPLLGTGFNVPYIYGTRDYSFTFDLPVENGNLLSAILGDIGLIGIFLFAFAYFIIFRISYRKSSIVLFLMPFVVTVAEAMFFSTNNIAILFYIAFGIYISDSIKIR